MAHKSLLMAVIDVDGKKKPITRVLHAYGRQPIFPSFFPPLILGTRMPHGVRQTHVPRRVEYHSQPNS